MATLGHTVLYEGPWFQFTEGSLDDGVECVRNVPLVNAIDIPHIPFDPPGAHVTVPYFLAFTPETPSSLGPTDLSTHACPLVPRDNKCRGPVRISERRGDSRSLQCGESQERMPRFRGTRPSPYPATLPSARSRYTIAGRCPTAGSAASTCSHSSSVKLVQSTSRRTPPP
jgi:hypothetical protein